MERTDQPTRQPSTASIREPVWGPAALQLRDQLRALLAADPAAEPWPAGVAARYLTVVGATVDLTGEGYDTAGLCGGCQGTPAQDGYISVHIDVVRRWAQAHAEKCRALPRPAVTA